MPKNILFSSVPKELECYVVKVQQVVNSEQTIDEYYMEGQENFIYCDSASFPLMYKEKNTSTISKIINGQSYLILYGYDDLDRVTSRTLFINDKKIFSQKYYLDILGKIVKYRDDFLQVYILRVGDDGKLLSYKIIDYIGNELSIENIFFAGAYRNTILNINGHRGSFISKYYINNKFLKNPQPTEEDFDLFLSMFLEDKNILTSKNEINKNIEFSFTYLPFSVRKLALLMN